MIQGHRRLDGVDQTPDGFPLPLTGKPLTKTPVVVKQAGVELKQYPETCIPKEEEIGPNEMRLTCCGSGNPFVRRAQAATGWLCELGNGDKFVFDVGGGTVQNLWSLESHPALLDKLFLTHLHLDHVGDFHVPGNEVRRPELAAMLVDLERALSLAPLAAALALQRQLAAQALRVHVAKALVLQDGF